MQERKQEITSKISLAEQFFISAQTALKQFEYDKACHSLKFAIKNANEDNALRLKAKKLLEEAERINRYYKNHLLTLHNLQPNDKVKEHAALIINADAANKSNNFVLAEALCQKAISIFDRNGDAYNRIVFYKLALINDKLNGNETDKLNDQLNEKERDEAIHAALSFLPDAARLSSSPITFFLSGIGFTLKKQYSNALRYFHVGINKTKSFDPNSVTLNFSVKDLLEPILECEFGQINDCLAKNLFELDQDAFSKIKNSLEILNNKIKEDMLNPEYRFERAVIWKELEKPDFVIQEYTVSLWMLKHNVCHYATDRRLQLLVKNYSALIIYLFDNIHLHALEDNLLASNESYQLLLGVLPDFYKESVYYHQHRKLQKQFLLNEGHLISIKTIMDDSSDLAEAQKRIKKIFLNLGGCSESIIKIEERHLLDIVTYYYSAVVKSLSARMEDADVRKQQLIQFSTNVKDSVKSLAPLAAVSSEYKDLKKEFKKFSNNKEYKDLGVFFNAVSEVLDEQDFKKMDIYCDYFLFTLDNYLSSQLKSTTQQFLEDTKKMILEKSKKNTDQDIKIKLFYIDSTLNYKIKQLENSVSSPGRKTISLLANMLNAIKTKTIKLDQDAVDQLRIIFRVFFINKLTNKANDLFYNEPKKALILYERIKQISPASVEGVISPVQNKIELTLKRIQLLEAKNEKEIEEQSRSKALVTQPKVKSEKIMTEDASQKPSIEIKESMVLKKSSDTHKRFKKQRIRKKKEVNVNDQKTIAHKKSATTFNSEKIITIVPTGVEESNPTKKHYFQILKDKMTLPPIVTDLLKSLLSSGAFQAFLVGGSVCEALKPIAQKTDIDLVFGGDDPVAILKKALPKGACFTQENNLFKIRLNDRVTIDIWHSQSLSDARFKSCKPEEAAAILKECLEEDAKRRDFTVNALYASVDGTIYDPTGRGYKDLLSGLIHSIIKVDESFSKDPIRALRAIYYHNKRGMRLTTPLMNAIKNIKLEDIRDSIRSFPIRINSCLNKLLCHGNGKQNFDYLIEFDLLSKLFPELHHILNSALSDHGKENNKAQKVRNIIASQLQNADQRIKLNHSANINYIFACWIVLIAEYKDVDIETVKNLNQLFRFNFASAFSNEEAAFKYANKICQKTMSEEKETISIQQAKHSDFYLKLEHFMQPQAYSSDLYAHKLNFFNLQQKKSNHSPSPFHPAHSHLTFSAKSKES